MFVCFADFRKAFDRVNYWKLFKQLIDIGLSTQIVSLLAYTGTVTSMFVYVGGMLYHPRLLLETEQNRAGYCHHVCLTVT